MATRPTRCERLMLSSLQLEIARIMAELPEAHGFALAGGAALIVQGIVSRTTRDLDYFSPSDEEIGRALPAIEEALRSAGLTIQRIQEAKTFARLHISRGQEECLLDLARDARLLPAESTQYGHVVARDELAADKVLALFDRAQARDFVDVFALSRLHDTSRLIELARLKDPGFSALAFAEMLGTVDRLGAADFELDEASLVALRTFVLEWQQELRDSAG